MAARNKHDRKAPLWRRENTTTHGVRRHGGEYRWDRNTKAGAAWEEGRTVRGVGERRAGGDRRDYTPLYRFLLARVGEPWDAVHAEAVSRLDNVDPIEWMVAMRPEDEKPYVYIGENSAWSGLKVETSGRLARVDPTLGPEHMEPGCPCCTHTLNGVPFGRPFPGWGGRPGGGDAWGLDAEDA